MRSLRSRLFAWLIAPLLVVGATGAVGVYVFMERRLTAAYDLDLSDIARALVPHLHVRDGVVKLELTELADTILKADSSDQIFYAIFDGQGRHVTGDPHLMPPAKFTGDVPALWWDTRAGEPIRAVALQADLGGTAVTVMAAETTNKRERASRDALFSAIAPMALLGAALVLGIMFGVRRGLAPIERLREEVQSRSHVHLRPVDEKRVDLELRPLVHELNGMFARLEEAQRTQARFIANAAHQLRTPIAGLVTQLELAGSGAASAQHLAHAREAAARLARLAQQILSLAAADPISNPHARDADFDLAEMVKGHADAWLRAALSRGVEIEFELDPARVRGNALLAGELAANLVDNASRYGARTVTISTRRAGGRSLLEVADDGPGIPPTERSRIFERFHRLDTSGVEGSGLGLAIVSEIAQRHDATVTVDAMRDGKGTRITVSFPSPVD